MSTTALVWFRRDLRVHDHPGLTAAHRECVASCRSSCSTRACWPGASRPPTARGSCTAASPSCAARGADLVIRAGRPERELPALARECGASALYFASDVSPFATARDRRVEDALPEGVEVRRQPGVFVADIGRVRTKDGRPHTVFTPFRRAWEQVGRREVHGAPRALAFPSGLGVGRLPATPEPEATEPFPPGERAARERATAWLRHGVAHYNPVTQQRRHDPGGEYVRRRLRELRDVPDAKLAEPWTMTAGEQAAAGCAIGTDYPAPVVDHKVERERALARYGTVRR